MDYQPIATARFVEEGTIADLKMPSGHTVKAVWEFRGQVCAWWPHIKAPYPVGLYEPREWRPLNRPMPSASVSILPVMRVERP